MLRMLLGQWIRQQAQGRVMDALQNKLHDPGEDEEQEGPRQPPPPCEIAFVFALDFESGGLVDLLPEAESAQGATFTQHVGQLDGRQVVIAETGVGQKRAAAGVRDLIAIHQPAWVVSAGFAGGLRDELRRGHMLMADRVVNTKGEQLETGFRVDAAAASKSLHVGRLLTVDKIIRESKEKRRLAEEHDALACDMETYAVAKTCAELKAKFMSVRVISDAVDETLPPEIEKLLNQQTLAGKIGAAAGAMMNRLSSVSDMWRLKEQAIKASDRLARFLCGVAKQLPDDRPKRADLDAEEAEGPAFPALEDKRQD